MLQPKSFYQKWTRNRVNEMTNFDSDPFTCEPTFFPAKNSPHSLKSKLFSLGKERGDIFFILTCLGSPMAEIFLHYCQYFLTLAIFRGKLGINVMPKVQILGPSFFYKNSDPSKIFQTMFLFAKVLPLVKISARLDHIFGSKGPKTSRCHVSSRHVSSNQKPLKARYSVF